VVGLVTPCEPFLASEVSFYHGDTESTEFD